MKVCDHTTLKSKGTRSGRKYGSGYFVHRATMEQEVSRVSK